MGHQAALIVFVAACQAVPYGEVLVEVDSEPSVPAFLSRLRVDLYDLDGTWYQSRDIGAPSAADWPLSFSLYTDESAGKSVRLRLRGYPEGGVRDFLGERFQPPPPFTDPPSPHSLSELCDNPPRLDPGVRMTLRRAAAPITELMPQNDCAPPTRAGSVAVKIEIPETAQYHFEVTFANPTGAVGDPAGDTTLFLRKSCNDPSTQLACNDDLSAGDFLSRFDALLDPGEYFLLTGGKTAGSPADVTLAWSRADLWDPNPPAPSPTPEPSPDPRDTLVGANTPDNEPQPNLAIDLISDVHVSYGRRSTAHLLLRGECLGTQADLRGGLACADTAGVRVPVALAKLEDDLHHTATRAGSWAAEQPRPCGGMPHPPTRDASGTPLHDEEVCIPGGAFLLGNSQIIGLGVRNGTPGQPAVVGAFFLDRYEFSVARYRQALLDGFVPPDDGPTANDADLTTDVSVTESPKLCTFSTMPRGRETMPLNCVTWNAARALCRFLGGDLPSHVGWEYAAVARPEGDSYYPWGDQPPDCCQAVWGRGAFDMTCIQDPSCPGIGPAPVDAEPWASRDVSRFNVSGMGGNLIELAADSMEPYGSPCWRQHLLHDVGCQEQEATARSGRGGTWVVNGQFALSAGVTTIDPGIGSTGIGFRCARQP